MPESLRAAGGPAFTFVVLRDPTLNAFAMPNGRIYVHTGLLSRLENEAQLAAILGHEMTHVTSRHALELRERDATDTPIPSVDLGAAALSRTASAVLGLGLQLAAIAAINGYGRDLEREADTGGMESLVRAGYDPGEAPKVFELLRRGSRDRGPLEIFFFGNPQRLGERVESTRELMRTTYAGAAADPARVKNTEAFGLRMRSVVRENAYEDIRSGRYALAGEQLDRVLAATPADPIAHLYHGDLYRLQSQRARSADDRNDKAQKALASYQRSLELDPAQPEPHRQLGLLYYQQKDSAKARAAFEQYLALKPDAPDAARIKGYIAELDR